MNILEIILTGGLTVMGTMFTVILSLLKSKLEKIEKESERAAADLTKFQIEVANKYASREDVKALEGVITTSFSRLSEKMDEVRKDVQHQSETFRDKLEQKQDKT